MIRAVHDRILKDVNGNISDHLRTHIHLTNCIHLKNQMHKHSPVLADRALMRDLVFLQGSRSFRDPSTSPPSWHSPAIDDVLLRTGESDAMVNGRRSVGIDRFIDGRGIDISLPPIEGQSIHEISRHNDQAVPAVSNHSRKSVMRERRKGKREESSGRFLGHDVTGWNHERPRDRNDVEDDHVSGNFDSRDKNIKQSRSNSQDVHLKTLSDQLNEFRAESDNAASSRNHGNGKNAQLEKNDDAAETTVGGYNSGLNRVKRSKFRGAIKTRPESADGSGAAVGERPLSSPLMSPANPSPSEIGPERWERAEKTAHMIICKVQPTAISEERRRDVIEYVQRLIRNRLGAEVFPYGSVPLKTYLPDGDIDLTAFGANVEDRLAEDMKFILEEEENNRSSEFVIKDVQLISAEVKLVKCLVQNIVVDISFNQIGGLCTLCFLEQVDRLIGKNHLFKRSIILIKSWCFYESRILGAHHGLISTYALETLVLYIFHLFHTTLDGPLAVLYKFLEYFSKFDWEMYCISLNGPVRISSLPVIVAETPEDGSGDLLLTDDFLRSCIEMFSVPLRYADQKSRGFQQKHLNIVDPLKEINNLGRSISKGNFYRIRSAFSYGAKKLERILMQPEDRIANELQIFFSSTMQRHGRGEKPVVQDPYPQLTYNGLIPASSCLGTESYKVENSATAVDHHFLGDADDLATPSIECLNISSDSPKFYNQVLKESVNAIGMHQDSDHASLHQGTKRWSAIPESSNSLSDLSGDYDSHFISLHYGRWFYEYTFGVPSLPMAPMPPPQYENKNPWDGVLYPSQLGHNGFSQGHPNGFMPMYPMSHILVPGAAFSREEMPKHRGTGTYFPKMNRSPQGYRPSAVKGKNYAPLRSPRDNGRNVIFTETNLLERNSHEQSQPQVLADQSINLLSSGIHQSFSPRGSGPTPSGTFFSERNRQQRSAPSSPQFSIPDSPGIQRPKPALSRDPDRGSFKSSYHLKDQKDFPPLSV